jgi:phosphatidylglycerophosphate synthase
MKISIKQAKPIADFLTLFRFFLGLVIAVLGYLRSSEGLQAAILLVLLSWLTDIVDGRLARRDPDAQDTWLGRHEAEADLSTSLGVTVYLVFSGYIPIWFGVLIVFVLPAVWLLHSHQLAWPLYALPYAILLIVAFDGTPALAWLMVAYLLVTLVIQFPRLSGEHLPEFFQSIRSFRGQDR